MVSMSKKEINIQGAIFEYSGSNNSIERINSTDRLEEELVLQVNAPSLVRSGFNHICKQMAEFFAFKYKMRSFKKMSSIN